MLQAVIYFLICLAATTAGGISGVGGGVIIKPVMDAVSGLGAATISFLSGCTVLAMTITSMVRSRGGSVKVEKRRGTFLAIGAAFGGIVGKEAFELVRAAGGSAVDISQQTMMILLTAGVFIRLVRTNVISTYNSGYVEAARSRGVSEKRLLSKHAWRPALIPIITVMGMQIAVMLAGAVLTETTFEWKGLGFMLSNYLKARDFVAVQGIVILIAIIVSVANFIVDVISALIDPRVRY